MREEWLGLRSDAPAPRRGVGRRAAKQCHELAPYHLIELHSVPCAVRAEPSGYQIGADQSAGIAGTLNNNGSGRSSAGFPASLSRPTVRSSTPSMDGVRQLRFTANGILAVSVSPMSGAFLVRRNGGCDLGLGSVATSPPSVPSCPQCGGEMLLVRRIPKT